MGTISSRCLLMPSVAPAPKHHFRVALDNRVHTSTQNREDLDDADLIQDVKLIWASEVWAKRETIGAQQPNLTAVYETEWTMPKHIPTPCTNFDIEEIVCSTLIIVVRARIASINPDLFQLCNAALRDDRFWISAVSISIHNRLASSLEPEKLRSTIHPVGTQTQ